MNHDAPGRALLAAVQAYLCARKPTAELTHALVDAVMRLIAARSETKVTLIVGDGLITRGEK